MSARRSMATELFLAAVELEPLERARYLDQACAQDAGLRAEVEELLACDARAPEAFLRVPERPDYGHLAPGTRVGRYVIEGVLGEGGMGVVYAAQQEAPRRAVALKLIRPGRLDERAARRLEEEAQLLGALVHPGIAQVFEAGTAQLESRAGGARSVPFLALELVRGPSLREHLAALGSELGPRLRWRARVELVARVCDAIQHAHQGLIVHRDLKPENILVVPSEVSGAGEFAAIGQPKVLDFGIARSLAAGGAAEAAGTGRGAPVGSLLGTLAYMSPEQVRGDGGPLDTRSDVYALGVILFESITGQLPLELEGCPLSEGLRRIRDGAPRDLLPLAPGAPAELQDIVQRALAKRRAERYPSAGELAADLRRLLRGEPVEARTPSAFYVLRKALGRHRALATVSVLLLVSILAFAVVASLQAARNRQLAQREQAVRRRAEQELTVSNIERGRLFGLAGNFLGEPLLWREFLRQPQAPHARWALWEFYFHNPCVLAQRAHPVPARAAAVDPDGAWVATGDQGGRIRIWDRLLGSRRRELLGVESGVVSLAVSADGAHLAAGHLDGTLALWDVDTGLERWRVRAHSGIEPDGNVHSWGVRCARFLPDGARVLSGGSDGVLRVFDAQAGTRLDDHRFERPIESMDLDPEAQRVAVATHGSFHLVELADLSVSWAQPIEDAGSHVLCFDRTGERLFVGGKHKRLEVWDLASQRRERTLELANGTLRSLTLAADGTELFASGWYRVERLSLPELESLGSVPFFDQSTRGVAVYPAGERVLTIGDEGVARLWDTGRERAELRFGGLRGRTSCALSPSGDWLAAGDESGQVRLFRLPEGREVLRLSAHGERVRRLQFHPHLPLLVSGADDGQLVIFDLQAGVERQRIDGFGGGSSGSFRIDPTGQRLGWLTSADSFRVFELGPDGLCDASSGVDLHGGLSEGLGIDLAPDGSIATVSRRPPMEGERSWLHQLDLWGPDGGHRRTIRLPGIGLWMPRFLPSGEAVLLGSWQWSAHLVEVSSGAPLGVLDGHDGTVWDQLLVPGSQDLAFTCSSDGTARLWSLEQERSLLTLELGRGTEAVGLAMDAAGGLLAVAGSAGEVRLFDLEYFERHVAGNLVHQAERLGGSPAGSEADPGLLRWARDVQGRPWPRLGPRPGRAR